MPQSRQLSAIMFTDIVGYTALMGKDEHKAFALLNKNRQLQKSFIEAFNGRWIKELGDGTMASFNTVSDAVNAAVKIQEACNAANDFQLRIGIHQGEVVFENDDVFGDAVNIAARIQAAANPGCIFISEAVNHNVANKKDIKTLFVKEEILKNVSQPVRMYQVMIAGSEIIIPEKPVAKVVENSIAVLPFANMSSDPEQEFFSDGITEEIINMLAQVPQLKVIGRTSSFAFKGKNLDLKFIGEQLKVSYILEGSVRKSGNKLRVTAQLISVADGFHLYSEKFDRELEDVFAIQDEVSFAILNAIKVRLFEKERTAVLNRYTNNVDAYQLYLQGLYHYNRYTPDFMAKAIEFYQAATNIDSNYALAYAEMSSCYWDLAYFNWGPREESVAKSIDAINKALQLDGGIAESHINMGRIKLWYEWDFEGAANELEKGLQINPNSAEGLRQLGALNMLIGNYKEAHQYILKADKLDPFSFLGLTYIGFYYIWCNDYEKMIEYANRLNSMEPNFFGGHQVAGLAYCGLHRYEDAVVESELAAKLNSDIMSLQILAMAYSRIGEKAKAHKVLQEMSKLTSDQNEANPYFGNVYAALGEWDLAFEYYDKGVRNHEGHSLAILPVLAIISPEMKRDPRTLGLLERMGLLRYENP